MAGVAVVKFPRAQVQDAIETGGEHCADAFPYQKPIHLAKAFRGRHLRSRIDPAHQRRELLRLDLSAARIEADKVLAEEPDCAMLTTAAA